MARSRMIGFMFGTALVWNSVLYFDSFSSNSSAERFH